MELFLKDAMDKEGVYRFLIKSGFHFSTENK